MFNIIRCILPLIFSYFISSCIDNDKSKNINKSFLPNASGENSEMLIVMDSTSFKSDIGRLLVDTYGSFVSGLPQPERQFDLRYIKPRGFNSILKHAKNIVIVFTLDGRGLDSEILRKNFNEESLKRIENDTSLYYFTKRDQYANGQIILYLFGKTEKLLLKKIKRNKKLILRYFEDEVKKRTFRKIFNKKEENIALKILEDHKIKIEIPYGYDLAKNFPNYQGNFFWLRQIEPDLEKNIFVYYEDFNENNLKDFTSVFDKKERSVVDIRNKISKRYLTDSENNDIYMEIQEIFPVEYKDIVFNNHSGVEAKGLWKLSNISAGGPFRSLVIYDQIKNRAYYIEGYVFAPGQKKRDLMYEINSILNTFEM